MDSSEFGSYLTDFQHDTPPITSDDVLNVVEMPLWFVERAFRATVLEANNRLSYFHPFCPTHGYALDPRTGDCWKCRRP